jgi:ferredoxin
MYLFNNPQVDSIISLAMNEDIGTGDITTLSTIPADKNAFGRFIAKEDMIICGIDLAKYVFSKVDTSIEFNANFKDGDKVIKGDVSNKKKVKIDNELCIGCTICKKQCKFDAIQGELKEKHSVDESKCVGCHLCMQKCPKKAIKTI